MTTIGGRQYRKFCQPPDLFHQLSNLLQIMLQAMQDLMECAVYEDPSFSKYTFRLKILENVGTIRSAPCIYDGEEKLKGYNVKIGM